MLKIYFVQNSLVLPCLSENCCTSCGEDGGDVWLGWHWKREAVGGNPPAVLPRGRAGESEAGKGPKTNQPTCILGNHTHHLHHSFHPGKKNYQIF